MRNQTIYIFQMYSFIANSEKYCEIRAKELSQFNGCSIPEWIPKDLVNTHGENNFESLYNYMWGSKKPSKENYAQIFETDCNKHDICYGCVSFFTTFALYRTHNSYQYDYSAVLTLLFEYYNVFYISRDLITT